ncbi:hypothetical protein [Actinomycetospora sp. NBRC 106378]|jgi:hypothetical protein|uniref:hypothetical protein n=1 Tax=Actinomycetospora sp. NBRC 106378 TaxID=3032208 RepID=UPI0024A3D349|nr:hypothetical protein [Actinomycetospora sp. NBRC 106378]GLZ54849.1 hypothetical protein Acsp07_44660 [Actinomycetospora sp. NBRC 106378]
MALETVLLALLGVVAVGLVIDSGRERHRLRARMDRATRRAATPPPAPRVVPPSRPAPNTGGLGPGSWQYWPVALPATDETRR